MTKFIGVAIRSLLTGRSWTCASIATAIVMLASPAAAEVHPDGEGPCSGPAATLTFTAPTSNESYNPNVTSITTTGSITAIQTLDATYELYLDGNILKSMSTGNFSVPVGGLSVGTHTLTLTASALGSGCTGSFSNSTSVSFKIVAGSAPAVSLSVASTATAPASIPLGATASGAYAISKVSYFINGALLGSATSAPYSYTWNPTSGSYTGVAAGSYLVQAQATDIYGDISALSPSGSTANVTVSPSAAPSVTLATPVASRAMLPATIALSATASSSYAATSMSFVVNGTSYPASLSGNTGTYTASVPAVVNATTVGSSTTYTITAQAANHWSSTGTSSPAAVNAIAHSLPTAAVTSFEATDFTPAELAVAATSTDVDMAPPPSVQLYLNGTIQTGQVVASSPYNFLVSGVSAATYTASVLATNQYGQTKMSANSSPVTVASSDPVVTGSANSQTRTIKYEYDTVTGRPSKVMQEPESSDLCLVQVIGRNTFGETNSVTTRNCNGSDANEAAAPTDLSVFTQRVNGTTYDTTGTYPTTQTNPLSQSSHATYDARFGVPLTQTDANGLVSTSTPDNFGRTTLVVAPDSTQTQVQYLYCSGVNGGATTCPASGAYFVQVTPTASNGTTQIGPIQVTYYDALGRVIQKSKQGFNGTSVLATTNYDLRGHVSQTSAPYYSGGTVNWTSATYDALNRKLVTTDVMGGTMTYSYNGVETTRVDGYGRKFTKTLNGRGQVIGVVDSLDQVSTYQYDPFGNLVLSVDPQGLSKTILYDIRGRKTSMLDPDMSGPSQNISWTYTYNAASDLVQQVDAKAQTVSMTYDVLGRQLTRTEPDLTSYWEYDVSRPECTSGAGKALGLADRAWTSTGYNRIDCVDALGRPAQERTTIGSSTFVVGIGYDASSRPISATYPAGSVYPSGFVVNSSYNAYGYLSQKTNASGGAVIWQANTMDALGDVTSDSMAASAFTTTRTFDAMGRLTSSEAGASNAIQNDGFVYDAVDGNLTSRAWIDANGSYSETFGYDNLNRLTTVTGPSNKTFAYDYSGNITTKSDVGTYNYTPGTHQVASIAGTANGVTNPTFAYDANGNLTSEDGVTTAWSSFNMATSLTRGTATDTFQYGPEHMRIKQVATSSSGTLTTYYVGTSFEVVVNSAKGTTEYHNYISSSSRRVAMLIDSTNGTTSWRYFQQDQIHSVDVVTDQSGNLVERLSYDAFGRRRNSNGTDAATLLVALDDRGFTDEEELDNIGLINMNGRIYDPTIARFMSADPNIPRPFDLQSHNRYAYATNRPFIRVDATGFLDTPVAGTSGTAAASGDPVGPEGGPPPPPPPPQPAGGGMCIGCQWTVIYGPVPGDPTTQNPNGAGTYLASSNQDGGDGTGITAGDQTPSNGSTQAAPATGNGTPVSTDTDLTPAPDASKPTSSNSSTSNSLGITPNADGTYTIYVLVWGSTNTVGSVGHVFVGNSDGGAITSPFPDPQGVTGPNVQYDYFATIQAENRAPDAVFQVTLPNSSLDAVTAAAQQVQDTPTWAAITFSGRTNCARAATSLFQAGGLPSPPGVFLNMITPDNVLGYLNGISSSTNNYGVSAVSGVPESFNKTGGI